MIAVIKIIGILASQAIEINLESVNVFHSSNEVEMDGAKVYFLEESKSSDEEGQYKGLPSFPPRARHFSWRGERGNQFQNENKSYGRLQQKIVVYSNMERLLEQVLEKVVSIDVGVKELKHNLLSLTRTVESHAISIALLEWRMNQLSFQVQARLKIELSEEELNNESNQLKLGNEKTQKTNSIGMPIMEKKHMDNKTQNKV